MVREEVQVLVCVGRFAVHAGRYGAIGVVMEHHIQKGETPVLLNLIGELDGRLHTVEVT